ncbi:MAG: imidazole glycerol phosphate synthase subunit HisH [Anaerolineales bacterium]|nr:imidazole glycerol phosphate synthase subunit HisH [Anaerolineales bacterium]
MNLLTVIDTGSGNLHSVQKALESVGANVEVTNDPQKVLRAKKALLPGVGAFGEFMRGLHERNLMEAIQQIANEKIPLLGICVGMQALFESGEEMGRHAGLGLLAGKVTAFPHMPGLKIPQTGWNQLAVKPEAALFDQVAAGAYVYFNHAYYCQPQNSSSIIATTEHGLTYASAVQQENIFGVQFHPEKSQRAGLQILKNFLELT